MGRKLVYFALIAFPLLPARSIFAADEVPAAPVFSPPGGAYNSAPMVKITDVTPGAVIYFTTNGETPTVSSTRYTGVIAVSESETLKAIAVANGSSKSAVASATFNLLATVLRKLDVSAAKFRSTTANFEFDSIQTEPVPDKEVQTGTVYYQRNGSEFKMAAHITDENAKPVPKTYVYTDGTVKLYEKLINQVTTLSKAAQYESWFMLGFGASGKDLEQKWDITYLGPETIDGIKTEKLKLIPKDPAVKKNVPQVTVWMDTDRAVSVKQVIDQGSGNSRECLYSSIRVNQSLPGDAFTLKTDRQTTYVSH